MSARSELPFRLDNQLTEVMRLRVQSLQQRSQKRQEGERLLQPNEAVYRLDFSKQSLRFSHWTVRLTQPGRLSITATSQLWTPDLTNLMTRQLLEPVGVFWRAAEDCSDVPAQCYEADAAELGERIAELAKVKRILSLFCNHTSETHVAESATASSLQPHSHLLSLHYHHQTSTDSHLVPRSSLCAQFHAFQDQLKTRHSASRVI